MKTKPKPGDGLKKLQAAMKNLSNPKAKPLGSLSKLKKAPLLKKPKASKKAPSF